MRDLDINKQGKSQAPLKAKLGGHSGVPSNTGITKKKPSWSDNLLGGASDLLHNAGQLAKNIGTNVKNAVMEKNVVQSGGYKSVTSNKDDNEKAPKAKSKSHYTSGGGIY